MELENRKYDEVVEPADAEVSDAGQPQAEPADSAAQKQRVLAAREPGEGGNAPAPRETIGQQPPPHDELAEEDRQRERQIGASTINAVDNGRPDPDGTQTIPDEVETGQALSAAAARQPELAEMLTRYPPIEEHEVDTRPAPPMPGVWGTHSVNERGYFRPDERYTVNADQADGAAGSGADDGSHPAASTDEQRPAGDGDESETAKPGGSLEDDAPMEPGAGGDGAGDGDGDKPRSDGGMEDNGDYGIEPAEALLMEINAQFEHGLERKQKIEDDLGTAKRSWAESQSQLFEQAFPDETMPADPDELAAKLLEARRIVRAQYNEARAGDDAGNNKSTGDEGADVAGKVHEDSPSQEPDAGDGRGSGNDGGGKSRTGGGEHGDDDDEHPADDDAGDSELTEQDIQDIKDRARERELNDPKGVERDVNELDALASEGRLIDFEKPSGEPEGGAGEQADGTDDQIAAIAAEYGLTDAETAILRGIVREGDDLAAMPPEQRDELLREAKGIELPEDSGEDTGTADDEVSLDATDSEELEDAGGSAVQRSPEIDDEIVKAVDRMVADATAAYEQMTPEEREAMLGDDFTETESDRFERERFADELRRRLADLVADAEAAAAENGRDEDSGTDADQAYEDKDEKEIDKELRAILDQAAELKAMQSIDRHGPEADRSTAESYDPARVRLGLLMDPSNPTYQMWSFHTEFDALNKDDIVINNTAINKAMMRVGITTNMNIHFVGSDEETGEINSIVDPTEILWDPRYKIDYPYPDKNAAELVGLAYTKYSPGTPTAQTPEEGLARDKQFDATHVYIDGTELDKIVRDQLAREGVNEDHPAYSRAYTDFFANRVDYTLKLALVVAKRHFKPTDWTRGILSTGFRHLQLMFGRRFVMADPRPIDDVE